MSGFQKGNTLWKKASHKGQPAWNKGLTKETDERVRKYALSGSITNKGKHRSPATEYKKGNVSFSKLHPECMQRGNNHYSWKEKVKSRKYLLITKPEHPFCNSQGYIREHRLVVEKQIGRYLLPTERVHHIGKKDDNRPCMLMAFINESAHQRFERHKKIRLEEIIYDGRN